MLKDPALCLPGEEEGLRHEVQDISRERGVPRALSDPIADAVDAALFASRQRERDGDLLAQESVEGDRRGVLGDTLELKKERPGYRFVSREAVQEQNVLAQRRRDFESAAILRVGHSAPLISFRARRKNPPPEPRDRDSGSGIA